MGSTRTREIYSQGYNLVKFLGSAQGGGHHVITKRRLMLGYSLKGINFLVPLITTTTDDSFYLKGQSTSYPTVLLDFDGNERAAIHLRNSDLNLLHILFQQLQRDNLVAADACGCVRTRSSKRSKATTAMADRTTRRLDEELAGFARSHCGTNQTVGKPTEEIHPAGNRARLRRSKNAHLTHDSRSGPRRRKNTSPTC